MAMAARPPTSLFYIERDPRSRIEIGERETQSKSGCKQAASSTRADLPSPPPFRPSAPAPGKITQASCSCTLPPPLFQ